MRTSPKLKTDLPESVKKYARHVNPAFVDLLSVLGYGRVFVKAKDVWLWDQQGRQYLDFLSGFGSVNIGHNHPHLIQKIKDFLTGDALQFCHASPSTHTADLAEALAKLLPDPLNVSLFSNSGAEAVEAGMKLARAATGRETFLYCENAFHGTSLGALSVVGKKRWRKPFGPLLKSFSIPFGNLEALQKSLATRKIAAFIVEPVQAEAGVVFPPEGYLTEAQSLCRKYGTLLILDEIQTGLGRMGSLFAFEQETVIPDILVLAKSLSGGISPIGVTVTSPQIHKKAYGSMKRFDLHSSTFGGNALSCITALETLRIIEEEELTKSSRQQGEALLQELKTRLRAHPLVKDIRGKGLLIGIELGATGVDFFQKIASPLIDWIARSMFGQWVSLRLLEAGVLCQPSSHHWNVLKLEPPLTLKQKEREKFVDLVETVLKDYSGILQIIRDVTHRVRNRSRLEIF